MQANAIRIDQAAELLDAEPPARALSPIVYDPKTGLYVLFGGDHCDYLTNDTWVFDPKKDRWEQRHPHGAPPPRANHELKAGGDGTVRLTGGYTYFSNTDYCGGQYVDVGDGPWTYDVAANRWTGKGEPDEDDVRVYRSGPFLPEYFLQGPSPDAAAHQKRLAGLPCPSCGTTRGVLAVLSGRPLAAWGFNPLTMTVMTVVTALFAIRLATGRSVRLHVSRRERTVLWIVAVALIVCNWVYVIRYVG